MGAVTVSNNLATVLPLLDPVGGAVGLEGPIGRVPFSHQVDTGIILGTGLSIVYFRLILASSKIYTNGIGTF